LRPARSRRRTGVSHDRPTLVISDVHLGRAGMVETADELDELVDAASTLVINGDVAELHVEEWSVAAARELERLRERCRRSDTRLVLLAGNHDPELTPRRHLVLANDQLLVTHGDAVHESLAPWSDAASIIRARHREVLAAMSEEKRASLAGSFEAAREAAKAECEALGDLGKPTTPYAALSKPWKLTAIGGFWLSHAGRMNRFASAHAPSASTVLVGHTHRAGIERVGGRTIINTGCFGVPGPALAVVIGDDELEVRRIIRRSTRSGPRWSIGDHALHRDPTIRLGASILEIDDDLAAAG
jgi:predicted phosphodiesterase